MSDIELEQWMKLLHERMHSKIACSNWVSTHSFQNTKLCIQSLSQPGSNLLTTTWIRVTTKVTLNDFQDLGCQLKFQFYFSKCKLFLFPDRIIFQCLKGKFNFIKFVQQTLLFSQFFEQVINWISTLDESFFFHFQYNLMNSYEVTRKKVNEK